MHLHRFFRHFVAALLAGLLGCGDSGGGGTPTPDVSNPDSASPETCSPACTDGASCIDGFCVPPGACVPPCSSGSACVDGQCVPDTPANECIPACSAGFRCTNGVCQPTDDPNVCVPGCASGFECSDGTCQPTTDPNQCSPACTTGYACSFGVCVAEDINDDHRTDPGTSWTVLVYVVGDNDLEEFAVQDIYEMYDVGGSQQFRFVLQVDRATSYSSSEVPGLGDWTSTRRLVLESNSFQQVADLGELNMASPATLADFIHWGLSTYPADRTMLVLWDHGAGWMGFGVDEASPGRPMLSLAQIKQGLSQGLQRAGLRRFDALGFDACLMASFEVAAVLQPFAEYLLASQELEPGHGWDYRAFSAARVDPTLPTLDLLRSILNGYFAQATQEKQEKDITLSVLDLTRLSNLKQKLDSFASTLAQHVPNDAAVIGRQRETATRFGKNQNPAADFHLVDLGDLSRGLAGADNQSFGSSRQALVGALSEIVVMNQTGPLASRATGVSLYFPPSADFYNQQYDSILEVANWRNFLRRFYTGANSIDPIQLSTSPGSVSVGWVGELATIDVLLPPGSLDILTSIDANFGIVDPVDNSVLILLAEPAAWSQDAAHGEWDGTAVVLSQGTTQSFSAVEVSVDESGAYLLLDVPLAYQRAGSQDLGIVMMRSILLASTFEVHGSTFYEYSDTGVAELDPRSGDMLIPIVPAYLDLGSGDFEWRLLTDATFRATAPIDLLFENIFPQIAGATLYLDITVTDYGGNFDWRGGLLELSGGTVGTAACSEVYDCATTCEDESCEDACVGQGSAVAQQQWAAVVECLIASNCQDWSCFVANCRTELDNCGVDTSADNCGAVTEVGQCVGNVVQFCDGGRLVELNCAQDGQTCGFNNDEGYYDCLGGPTGSYSCDEVYACFVDCGDDACLDSCYYQGTATAQSQINNMYGCFDDYCGTIADENQWQQCVEVNCSAEIDACFGG